MTAPSPKENSPRDAAVALSSRLILVPGKGPGVPIPRLNFSKLPGSGGGVESAPAVLAPRRPTGELLCSESACARWSRAASE